MLHFCIVDSHEDPKWKGIQQLMGEREREFPHDDIPVWSAPGPNTFFILGEEHGKPVGYIICNWIKRKYRWPNVRKFDRCIGSIGTFVTASHRRKGVAPSLRNYLAEYADEQKIPVIWARFQNAAMIRQAERMQKDPAWSKWKIRIMEHGQMINTRDMVMRRRTKRKR